MSSGPECSGLESEFAPRRLDMKPRGPLPLRLRAPGVQEIITSASGPKTLRMFGRDQASWGLV